MADKSEWLNKLRSVINSKGGEVKGESAPTMRQSLSDSSLVSKDMMFSPFKMYFLLFSFH